MTTAAHLTTNLQARLAPHPARHSAPPPPAPEVPPRQEVPDFPPIRRGVGSRHRLRQAVRLRPGILAVGLLAAATALTAGPLRHGPPPGPAAAGPAICTRSGAPTG